MLVIGKKIIIKHDIFQQKQVIYGIIIGRVCFGSRKKTVLITMAGISTNILAKLGKGEFISMESMQKICKALDCDVGDICVINEKVEEGKE